jgi:hypothetical protein
VVSLTSLLSQNLTVRHTAPSSSLDDYGMATPVVTDSDDDVRGLLEPLSEQEQLVEAQTYRTEWRLYLLPQTEVKPQDLVVDELGQTYEILEVLPFFNPRAQEPHHIECRVVEIAG